jgi:uncharacterized protein involved in cysteine biosynthesis
MIRSFFAGVFLPRDAALLIWRTPALWAWSAIPILLTLLLTVFGVVWADAWVAERLMQMLASAGLDSNPWLTGIAVWSARIVLILVGAVLLSTTGSIVASPFNDFLAEETEKHVTPPLPPAPSPDWRGRVKLLILDLGKNIAIGILTVIVLLASWIPGVNFFAFAAAMWLLTFQFTSFPQTRRGETLGDGFRFLGRHPCACLGFGVSLSFLFAIPVMSAFVIPLAVVGGTMLVARASELR